MTAVELSAAVAKATVVAAVSAVAVADSAVLLLVVVVLNWKILKILKYLSDNDDIKEFWNKNHHH